MRVIINADDFGLTEGVNHGIIKAHKEGIVTSATIMANMPAFENAVNLSKENPHLGIGVHLTLTAGKSLGKNYKSLTNSESDFHKLKDFQQNLKNLDLDEVEHEFELQIEKVRNEGIAIDHLDSHHHVHTFKPIIDVALKITKKHNLPLRLYSFEKDIRSTASFKDTFYGEKANILNLLSMLSEDEESMEIMTHPAICDESLKKISSYNELRNSELSILTNHEVKEFIKKNNIELIKFSQL